ncbi:hypothetical protein TREMEDRAFT_64662 [Tremella mesenterica DSM 1558]|uniref:uncharacterized protein n=1 Tax=Tremella mesenterica (strain ATCC 24925 / CBS 8224 / DSM 1558 / NBRC 9311 / NRRL Y-6157 / RJB 2259-6 / UBC 559-6) TaxID=578456 RepID=UPI0003F499F0|nr:uncharacterized protein TREMEDRAFT_64662 [Tremella mesenterica DSM 1558]EIW67406.1 hypothetical protein TREMEDRAFT_64662 [Tremella mesenterica DSM 1558]
MPSPSSSMSPQRISRTRRSDDPPDYPGLGLDESPPPYIRETTTRRSIHRCGLGPSSPTHQRRWDGISTLSATQQRSEVRAELTLRVMNMDDSDSDTQPGSSVEKRRRCRTGAMDTTTPLSLKIKTNQGNFISKLANGSDDDKYPSSPETMYNTPTSDDEVADDESPSSGSQNIYLAPDSCSNAPWMLSHQRLRVVFQAPQTIDPVVPPQLSVYSEVFTRPLESATDDFHAFWEEVSARICFLRLRLQDHFPPEVTQTDSPKTETDSLCPEISGSDVPLSGCFQYQQASKADEAQHGHPTWAKESKSLRLPPPMSAKPWSCAPPGTSTSGRSSLSSLPPGTPSDRPATRQSPQFFNLPADGKTSVSTKVSSCEDSEYETIDHGFVQRLKLHSKMVAASGASQLA